MRSEYNQEFETKCSRIAFNLWARFETGGKNFFGLLERNTCNTDHFPLFFVYPFLHEARPDHNTNLNCNINSEMIILFFFFFFPFFTNKILILIKFF